MKKTMCRWCGGEMEIYHFKNISVNENADRVVEMVYYFACTSCNCTSDSYHTPEEALEWASQPIPFLPKPEDKELNIKLIASISTAPDRDTPNWMEQDIKNGMIYIENAITAALAVREEEQK